MYTAAVGDSALLTLLNILTELFQGLLLPQSSTERGEVRRFHVPYFAESVSTLDPKQKELLYIVLKAFVTASTRSSSNTAHGLILSWSYLQRDGDSAGNALYAQVCSLLAEELACFNTAPFGVFKKWKALGFLAQQLGYRRLRADTVILQLALAAHNDRWRIDAFLCYFSKFYQTDNQVLKLLERLRMNLPLSAHEDLKRRAWLDSFEVL